jgi:uncharacterized protein YkwD
MHRKVLVVLLLASCLWLVQSMVTTIYSDATPQVKSLNTVTFKHTPDGPDPNEVFTLANQSRETEGLPPLKANVLLTAVAESRAADMAKNHYYAHKDPSGHFYYDQFIHNKFSVAYSCENLDLEYGNDAITYVNDWLSSPFGHRQCLLNKEITDAGYAVTQIKDVDYGGTNRTAYIVVAIYSTSPSATQ